MDFYQLGTLAHGFDPAARLTLWEKLAEGAGFDRQRLARLCCISTRTLDRYFLRYRNQSVFCWLKELKMSLAWTRLPAAESVKEVSIDLGYDQASNFSRDFKARFGVTPSTRWSS